MKTNYLFQVNFRKLTITQSFISIKTYDKIICVTRFGLLLFMTIIINYAKTAQNFLNTKWLRLFLHFRKQP